MGIDGGIGTPVIMIGCVGFRTSDNTGCPDGSGSGSVNCDIACIPAIVEVEGSVADPSADTTDINICATLVSGDIYCSGITGILRLYTGSGITGDTSDAKISAGALGRAGVIGNVTAVGAILAASTSHIEITATVPSEQSTDAYILGAAGVLDISGVGELIFGAATCIRNHIILVQVTDDSSDIHVIICVTGIGNITAVGVILEGVSRLHSTDQASDVVNVSCRTGVGNCAVVGIIVKRGILVQITD